MDLEFNSMFKQEPSHALSRGITKNFELVEELDVKNSEWNENEIIWEIKSDEQPIQLVH